MAKRYRYAFAQQKEAEKGVASVWIAGISVFLFLAAVFISFLMEGNGGGVVGGISVFAMLSSVYGFLQGLKSFSQEHRSHRVSIVGSIANGVIMVGWLGLFLIGV